MKFAQPAPDEAQVPLTPLIDVVFLLLLFFMLAATFGELNFLELELPRAAAAAPADPAARLDLAVDAAGGWHLDGAALPADSQARAALRAALAAAPEAVVYVHAHALAPHGAVVQLAAAARAAGADAVRLATLGERLP